MKKIALTLLAVLAMCFVGCTEKENNKPTPDTPTGFNIVNTTWVGYYNDYLTHPQAGQVPVHLKWTIDFLEDSQAELFLEADADGQVQPGRTFNFTYQMDGLKGLLIYDDGEEHSEDPFEIDPYNNSFELELALPMGFSAEEPQTVGGTTVFHLMRQ